MPSRTGAELLVRALSLNGVDAVFCVPGESFIAALDVLGRCPAIAVVACRHEAAAATMAEATGKLTGRPGVAFVTRGPGAAHAAIGVHTARQDSTPMVLFVGQVARTMRGREAFQEVDYVATFGSLAKWAVEIDDAARIPEIVSRAFRTARSGRPGPVVVAVPEDVFEEPADAGDAPAATTADPHPNAAAVARVHGMLRDAQRPLVILGGGGWDDAASGAMRRAAAALALPVACTFRRQASFDNRDPHYVGHLGIGGDPALADRVRDADVVVAVGTRLSEAATSGYTLLDVPVPRQRLVHVYPEPSELGRVYAAEVPVNATAGAFASALAALPPLDGASRNAWLTGARADYERFGSETDSDDGVDLGAIVAQLSRTLPDDAIVCNGAGNYAAWVHRYFAFKRPGTQLAPTSGAMAYGLPAGIAAKLRFPERTVVVFAGDGDFLMTAHELATAAQYGANVIVVVVDNGMYGTIRMHQERRYPGRPVATTLRNPDFVALAAAHGVAATRIERTADFARALDEALSAERPSLFHVRLDPQRIAPRRTLAGVRDAYTTS